MRIAIEGCGHGELEEIYATIKEAEKRDGQKVDLLLCCGDFQSTRNLQDLKCMAVPDKFKKMCTFYKYYAAEPGHEAPILTIFIGGNHEASNYLQELPYGGWVAPNIFYLGYAGVVNVNGIRIGGLSGIYKGYDYCKGRFERPPYDKSSLRSVFHIRNIDVFRLKQLRNNPPDIILSHDWPNEIHKHGDVEALIRRKPFFEEDIKKGELGSRPAQELIEVLKPTFWFSAHLHVKFPAIVRHRNVNGTEEKETRFLALDKCLPRRQFLQVLDVDSPITGPVELTYDKEWLAILKSTNHLLSTNTSLNYMPGDESSFFPTPEQIDSISELFENNFKIPNNFEINSKPYDPSRENERDLVRTPLPHPKVNKQTDVFCDKLRIDDPIKIIIGGKKRKNSDCQENTVSISGLVDDSIKDCNNDIVPDDSNNTSYNKDEILLDDETEDNPPDENIKSEEANNGPSKVIDSTPKKAKLVLPEPKSEKMADTIADMHLECKVTHEGDMNKLHEIPLYTSSTTSDKQHDTESAVENPKKKLKRRNVAIYEDDGSE